MSPQFTAKPTVSYDDPIGIPGVLAKEQGFDVGPSKACPCHPSSANGWGSQCGHMWSLIPQGTAETNLLRLSMPIVKMKQMNFGVSRTDAIVNLFTSSECNLSNQEVDPVDSELQFHWATKVGRFFSIAIPCPSAMRQVPWTGSIIWNKWNKYKQVIRHDNPLFWMVSQSKRRSSRSVTCGLTWHPATPFWLHVDLHKQVTLSGCECPTPTDAAGTQQHQLVTAGLLCHRKRWISLQGPMHLASEWFTWLVVSKSGEIQQKGWSQ